ncbi:DUF3987 domain-containing protein [Thioalkalivibrio sp. ALJ2]|uniref:DUF3987 domain-containing protein n=1 Tax=Thioalkalivibrio sp. ALJ2 TaxID=1261622 RepID=UPI0003A1E6E5|nr:DUF3987 domain-containing protein [Thioalkalivibrio sp. ALJ2]
MSERGIKYLDERVAACRPEPEETLSEPLDLFGNLEPGPFPVSVLPTCIGEFAHDQGELMGVDPGVIGMAALTVVAGCTDDRIYLQPKRHDDTWVESARLWFAPVGPPSAKKSPALKKAMAPARDVDHIWREESNEKQRQYERELKRIKREKSDEVEPTPPIHKRLIFGDTTVEKMAAVMAKCEPRGMLVFRDELTGWLSSMDAYKNGSGKDRADWLETYNGDPNCIDRLSRDSSSVKNWSACIMGGIQPAVIHQYAGNTNHDGMLQRFMILYARGARQGQDRSPDMAAIRAYEKLVHQVADTRAGEVVTLSDGAHDAREGLWDRIHAFTQAHPNPYLTSALGKWEGLFSRLLLTFHVTECAARQEHPSSLMVPKDTAERVSTLIWGTLLPHAIRFYQELDETEDRSRKVAALILARGWQQFTVKRDLDRHLSQSRRWKPWELDEAMQRLESFGWLIPKPERLNERGRPSAYNVNPKVHVRFAAIAEQERRDRQIVADMMKGIGQ